jgi:undecaprenyl-diphosphatase
MLNYNESLINLFLQKNLLKNNMITITFILITHTIIFSYIILSLLVYLKKINIYEIVKYTIGMFIVMTIKELVGRPRPYVINNNITQYDNHVNDYKSFPSGHGYSAFYFYFLIDNIVPKNTYLHIFLKGFCIMVAFSRLVLGVHYITDIIASYMIIRYFIKVL